MGVRGARARWRRPSSVQVQARFFVTTAHWELFAGTGCPLSTDASAADDAGGFIHASVFDSGFDTSETSNRPKNNYQRAERVKNLTMASFLASSGTVLQGQRLSANRSQQCAARRSVAVTASHRVDKFSKNDVIVSPSILSANFSKLGEQVRPLVAFGSV